MNSKKLNQAPRATRLSLLLLAMTLPNINVHAEMWSWSTGGQWGNTASWVGGTVPNGEGAVADFTFDMTGTGSQYISNSGPNIDVTVGTLIFRDTVPNTGTNRLILSGGGNNGPITFDGVDATNAIIDVYDDMEVQARGGIVLDSTLVKTGAGLFRISNNSNISGTGGLTVNEGTVQFDRPAVYTGVTTVNSGGTVFINDTSQDFVSNLVLNGIGDGDNGQGVPYGALRSNGANITGTVQLASDTAIYLNGNTSTDFRDEISGIGELTVGAWPLNNPIVTFHADNTYTGGTVLNQNVTLNVGNGGTTGSLGTGAVDIAAPVGAEAGATLAFNRSDNLINANAVDNNITVDGTLQNNGAGLELDGVLSGSGTIVQSGSSYLRIDGANTFDGEIQVESGTVFIRGGATYAGDIAISSGALLDFAYSGSAATGDKIVSGIISGDGAVAVNNNFSSSATEKIVFTGVNTYTGATSINNNDILEVGGAAGTLGTGDVAVNSGGTLSFNRTSSGTIDNNIAVDGTLRNDGAGVELNGVLSGSGTIVQSGSYTNIDGANTFDGDIQVESGILRIRGGATYDGDFAVSSGAELEFGYSSSAAAGDKIVNGVISGDGVVDISNNFSSSATEKVVFTGVNTYTGGTSINNADILEVSGGGTLGTGDVVLNSGGSLIATTSISNTVNITGDSAISGTYTGTVDAGTIPSRAINTTGGLTAGTLTGQGTFSNGLVIIASAHNPGNSPGTQTFNDGLEYANGSSLTLEIAADGLSFDQIFVNGGLDIGTDVSLGISLFGSADYGDAFWDLNQSFNLITTDGYTGDFGSVSLIGLDSAPSEGSWTSDWVGNVYVASWTAVPEPSSALVGILIGAGLCRRRRAA